jgi:hypothetical protein
MRLLETYNRLDIRYLDRNDLLVPGRSFPLSWARGVVEVGSIWVDVDWGYLVLTYWVTIGGESENVEEEIVLDFTECNYGGERPWFLCPECGRRVGILALAGKYFRCRHCYQLYYKSQFETELDRAFSKFWKLWNRLGEGKPKGMHWRTYERLLHKLAEADNDQRRL